jgi:hypothetical protein
MRGSTFWYGYTPTGSKAHRVYYPYRGAHGRIFCTDGRVAKFCHQREAIELAGGALPWCNRCFDADAKEWSYAA